MDSRKIAAELERLHPQPPLHLDSPLLPKVQELIAQGIAPLRGVVYPKIPRKLLNPPSKEYFERTRAVRFGMPLPQLEKELGGDGAWEGAEPAMKELGAILRAEGGPFVLGKTGKEFLNMPVEPFRGQSIVCVTMHLLTVKTVSYTDLVIVGALQFLRRIQEDIFQRVVEIEPALKDVYEASNPWLERDDH